MQAIKDSRPEDINAWRHKKAGEAGSVENKTKNLLSKIKIAHDGPVDKPTKAHVSRMIADIWQQFFAEQEASVAVETAPQETQTITLKCYYGDDIRVVEISRKSTFEDIYNALITKFGGNMLQVTYIDEEGDYITVDSLATLEKAIVSQGVHRSQKALKLYLFERPVPLTGVSSPIGSPVGSPMGNSLLARMAADDVACPYILHASY
jgi:hypothetical protein